MKIRNNFILFFLIALILFCFGKSNLSIAQETDPPKTDPQGAEVQGSTKVEDPNQFIETMIQAINDKNDPMRNRMFFELQLLGEVSVKPLEKAIQSNKAEVQEYLIFTLGWVFARLKSSPDISFLLNILENGPEGSRVAAARAFGTMEEKRAVPALTKCLKDPSPKIKQFAAYALGLIGDSKPLEELEALLGSNDELVRFYANEAVDKIKWKQQHPDF